MSDVQDAGWADPTAARDAARRLKERRQRELLDDVTVVGVAQSIEHCPQADSDARPAIGNRGIGLSLRSIYRCFQRAWLKHFGDRDV